MLVMVMVAMVMLSGVMMASFHVFKTTENVIDFELSYHGQAVNTAKAGAIDALSWFRRQTAQPVVTFDPQRDLTEEPPINETDDAIIGLVREYPISINDRLIERYEIRLSRWLDNGTDDGITMGVKDITQERMPSGEGRFWYIEVKGYICEKLDDAYEPWQFYQIYETADGVQRTKHVDENSGEVTYSTDITTPNGILEEKVDQTVMRVLASARLATELRRLAVTPPAEAALCAIRGDDVSLGNRSRIMGGDGYGLIYPGNTGSHYQHSGAELSGGTPSGFTRADPANYPATMGEVFGVTQQELRTMCDIYTDDPSTLPEELPEYSLVYIENDVSFTSSNPLKGTAIVYVNGNAVIAASSSSYFSGILFVEGNFTQYAPSLVNGTVIVQGNISISGQGDYSEVDFDPSVRDRILSISGQYRFSAPMYFLD